MDFDASITDRPAIVLPPYIVDPYFFLKQFMETFYGFQTKYNIEFVFRFRGRVHDCNNNNKMFISLSL